MKNYEINLKKISWVLILLTIINLGFSSLGRLYSATPGISVAAPTANAATSVTNSSFYASWSSVSGATSYNIYVLKKIYIGTEPKWMLVTGYNKLPVGGTHITVTGLSGGTIYKYYVTANQISDESAHSNEIQVTTTIEAPTANTGSNITPISFIGSWNSVSGATSYNISLISKINGVIHLYEYTTTQTSYTFSNLTPSTQYQYGVIATNGTINSPNSNLITVNTSAATAPVAKNATSITTSSFTANWKAVTGATSYLLTVRDVTAGTFKVIERETEALSNSVTGLNPNNVYSYAVKAKFGEYVSDWSDLITVNTKPTPPVATAASNITTTSFNANWNAVAGATGYKLWIISNVNTGYNPAGYFPKTIGNVTTYNVTGLTSGHSYTYYVQVITSLSESTVSNSIAATTKPIAPAAMNAGNITSTSFVANWQTVISATSYKLSVWRKSDYQWVPGYNGKIVSGTSEVVTGLEPLTEYQYSLRALAGETESDNSNYINVTTEAGIVETFTLALSASPASGGTVSGGGTFNNGTTVTAHATANPGYEFVNWTENGTEVSALESYTFPLTANRTLVANFSVQTFTISAEALPAVGGSTNISSEIYFYNEDVTLEAIPAEGYEFVNWTENGIIKATTRFYIFNATANRHLVANFALTQVQNFTVTSSALPVAGGTTNITSESYPSGQLVTLIATPNAGYDFVNWTEDGAVVSTSASYMYTVTANRTLVANFSLQIFTITLSSNPTSGGITNFASTSFNYGENVTINANANANYQFVNWTANDVEVSASTNYTFMVTADVDLVANFVYLTAVTETENHRLTVYPNPASEVLAISNIPSGTTLTLTNLAGMTVKKFVACCNNEIINVGNLKEGVYFVVAETSEFCLVQKVMITRALGH